MRAKLARLLYKMRLRKLAHWISPSMACYLLGKDVSRNTSKVIRQVFENPEHWRRNDD